MYILADFGHKSNEENGNVILEDQKMEIFNVIVTAIGSLLFKDSIFTHVIRLCTGLLNSNESNSLVWYVLESLLTRRLTFHESFIFVFHYFVFRMIFQNIAHDHNK